MACLRCIVITYEVLLNQNISHISLHIYIYRKRYLANLQPNKLDTKIERVYFSNVLVSSRKIIIKRRKRKKIFSGSISIVA